MTGADTPKPPTGLGPARPGDIGRRIAHRRRQIGLSREEVADRAALAPEYLRYVEEQPANVGIGALLRVADALDITADELSGGEVSIPPGRGQAAARPVMDEMTTAECWARLGTHGVGRIALPERGLVEVLPVNYTVVDRTIVYRTTSARAGATVEHGQVSFEVDRVDEALRQGWSVLVAGPAVRVTDDAEVGLLERRAVSKPWAGGERPVWIRLSPSKVTGRNVRAG